MNIKTSGYETFGMIVVIVLLLGLIALGPLAIMWALNTLFPLLAIPYNFWTWLAVVVLNITWLSKAVKVNRD